MRVSCFLRPALRASTCQRFFTTFPRHVAVDMPRYSQSQLIKVNLAAVTRSKSQFSQLMLELLHEMSLEGSEDDEGGMKRGKRSS